MWSVFRSEPKAASGKLLELKARGFNAECSKPHSPRRQDQPRPVRHERSGHSTSDDQGFLRIHSQPAILPLA